jgi:hypothetical protein
VDGTGNAYVAGYTYSTDFPTLHALQSQLKGTIDAFVTKIGPPGNPVYSTYLGGGGDDIANGIAVDAAGWAYVTGRTSSTNFPLQNPLQNALKGDDDAFVAKLDYVSGSLALVYSTYLGGLAHDEGYGIAVDAAGCAYVAGYTLSADFPTMNPLQGAKGGNFDAFVAKLNAPGSALVYSTYLGGGCDDAAHGIAVDAAGCAYVAGQTSSTNFPLKNPLQDAKKGNYDAFVAKLNAPGAALAYSTYLGGSGSDFTNGIAVDATGCAYVAGHTNSTDFPTRNALQGTSGGDYDAFVAKISPAVNMAPIYLLLLE